MAFQNLSALVYRVIFYFFFTLELLKYLATLPISLASRLISRVTSILTSIPVYIAKKVSGLVASVIAFPVACWNFATDLVFSTIKSVCDYIAWGIAFVVSLWNSACEQLWNYVVALPELLWGLARSFITTVWNFVLDLLASGIAFIAGLFNYVLALIASGIAFVVGICNCTCELLWGVARAFIKTVWNFVLDLIASGIAFVAGLFNYVLALIASGIAFITGLFNYALDLIDSGIAFVTGLWSLACELLWSLARTFTAFLWSWSISALKLLWSVPRAFAAFLWSWSTSLFGLLWGLAGASAVFLWSWSILLLKLLWSVPRAFAAFLWSWSISLFGLLWSLARTFTAFLWNWSTSLLKLLWSVPRAFAALLWGWSISLFGLLWSVARAFTALLWILVPVSVALFCTLARLSVFLLWNLARLSVVVPSNLERALVALFWILARAFITLIWNLTSTFIDLLSKLAFSVVASARALTASFCELVSDSIALATAFVVSFGKSTPDFIASARAFALSTGHWVSDWVLFLSYAAVSFFGLALVIPALANWSLVLLFTRVCLSIGCSALFYTAVEGLRFFLGFRREMEPKADRLLATLRDKAATTDARVDEFLAVRAEIRQNNVSDDVLQSLFDAIVIGVGSNCARVCLVAFSTLGSLMKRLCIQEQQELVAAYGRFVYPQLLVRLGDPRERVREHASAAFTDFWPVAQDEVEDFVLNALTGNNARAKQMAMSWILTMVNDHGLHFRRYTNSMTLCLNDDDSGVRDTAKWALVELFMNRDNEHKNSLVRSLESIGTPLPRREHREWILARIGPIEPGRNFFPGQRESRKIRVAEQDLRRAQKEGDAKMLAELEREMLSSEVKHPITPYVTPLTVKSAQEVEDVFRTMAPQFEGRETEQNWRNRELQVIRLRELTMGNAPLFYSGVFFPLLKSHLDGIFKAVFSLRTTLCTNGCYLFIDLAYWYGSEMDGMAEIIIQNMLKVCVVSKKITAEQGNKAIDTVMAKASYKERLIQHIHGAITDKSVQLRVFAAGWLRTIINRHPTDKAAIEHGNGLGLIITCIKLGLKDANMNVRETTRQTYWEFSEVWPTGAESVVSSLDAKSKNLLGRRPPNTEQPGVHPAENRPVSAGPSTGRSTLRSTIATQRRLHRESKAREESLAAATGPSTLHSAPLRPKLRRPGGDRPATAEPHAPSIAASRPIDHAGDQQRDFSPDVWRQIGMSEQKRAKFPEFRLKMRARRGQAQAEAPKEVHFSQSEDVHTAQPEDVSSMQPDDVHTAQPDDVHTAQPEDVHTAQPEDMYIRQLEDWFSRHPLDGQPEDEHTRRRQLEEVYSTQPGDVPTPQPKNYRPSDPYLAVLLPSPFESPPPKDYGNFDDSLLPEDFVWEELEEARRAENPQLTPPAQPRLPPPTDDTDDDPRWQRALQERDPNRSVSPPPPSPGSNRSQHLLERGIQLIRSSRMDPHGFRKLRGVMGSATSSSWWSKEYHDQLVGALLGELARGHLKEGTSSLPLLDVLETALFLPKSVTNETMTPQLFYRTISSLLETKRRCDASSYFAVRLDEIASRTVSTELNEGTFNSVQAILDAIADKGKEENKNVITMGLTLLVGALQRQNASGSAFPENIMQRIGVLIAGRLEDGHAEVRRLVIQSCVHLKVMVRNEEELWAFFGTPSTGTRNLLAYYLARG